MTTKPLSHRGPQARPGTAVMTGGEIIWESLARLGVTHVFGYPGGAILPTYDALGRSPITHVLARHEQGAAHMADGFARASGRVGVAMATSGPGATNLVTGIATAMMDSSPIVCITGQVSSRQIGLDVFQEVDIVGITLPITKHNYLVTDASDIAATLREAFEIAASGRPGPVLVDIAKDAQQAETVFDWDATLRLRRRGRRVPKPAATDIERAVALIAAAERPLILVGHGALLSESTALVRALAERAGIPVATTLLGIGSLPASHPLNLGLVGMHGEPWANQAVQQADLLLALGMRFDDRAVGNAAGYAPGARKIHVDIDPAEINKTVKADVALVGDLRDVLGALLPRVPEGRRGPWAAHLAALRAESRARDVQSLPDDGRLHGAHVIHDLWRETGGEAVVVSDVGQNQMWEAQYYKHESPRSLITSGGLGTMGFALPAAIGAKIACPDKELWVIAGDGGFQMTQAELATVAQEGIPVKIAVINNGCLGMVRQFQEFFFDKRYTATSLVNPDFCQLAKAYGLAAFRVEKRADVTPAVRAARQHPGAALIDFRIALEDCVYPMVPVGANLHQMIRRPRPWPRRVAANGRKA